MFGNLNLTNYFIKKYFWRDFYFFHRSFYPQLQLLRLDAETAEQRIREHSFHQKLIETGKVLLTHSEFCN